MASGNTLAIFKPFENEPPSTLYAVAGLRNGHPTLGYDDTTSWVAIFTGLVPANYAGGGLTINIFATAIATSGTMGWLISIERMDAATDLDADSFAAAQTVTAATVPATSGFPLKLTGTFTSGAQMDNLVAGEMFRLKVARDVANDTAVGNVEQLEVEVKET